MAKGVPCPAANRPPGARRTPGGVVLRRSPFCGEGTTTFPTIKDSCWGLRGQTWLSGAACAAGPPCLSKPGETRRAQGRSGRTALSRREERGGCSGAGRGAGHGDRACCALEGPSSNSPLGFRRGARGDLGCRVATLKCRK